MNVSDTYFRTNVSVVVAAFVAGTAIMAAKFYGYWITGSSAILSDALESIINVVASAFALVSVLLSAKPPDESHPYGHGKIEYFSAGFEGALIIVAAVGIFIQGLRQIFYPQSIPNLENGLLIVLATGTINLILGSALVRTGKRTGSIVLIADGKHILTDVYTTAVVLIGIGLVFFTGWYRLDGVIASIAGINILFSGSKLVRQGFAGLMNTSDPGLLADICDILSSHRRDIWIDVHRLRAWRSGNRVHIDFHLILPRDLPLHKAHLEVKELEGIFNEHFKGAADMLIHLDPCEDPECPVCNNDPCALRQKDKTAQRHWHAEALTKESISNSRSSDLTACAGNSKS